MDWGNGISFRFFAACLTEWIKVSLIRPLELAFSGFGVAGCFQLAIGLEQHSLALRLELMPGYLEGVEPGKGWAVLNLHIVKVPEYPYQSFDGVYEAAKRAKYLQNIESSSR